jgi:hypothetical protein
VPQQELAAYSTPVSPNRQLTKRDLGSFDFKLLNAIEAVANSAPYLGNEVFRNDLILDNKLRTSNAYSEHEWWSEWYHEGALDTSHVTNHPSKNRNGSKAVRAPATKRVAAEGTRPDQLPRASQKQAAGPKAPKRRVERSLQMTATTAPKQRVQKQSFGAAKGAEEEGTRLPLRSTNPTRTEIEKPSRYGQRRYGCVPFRAGDTCIDVNEKLNLTHSCKVLT